MTEERLEEIKDSAQRNCLADPVPELLAEIDRLTRELAVTQQGWGHRGDRIDELLLSIANSKFATEKLEAENARLKEALKEVTPSFRPSGSCWCSQGRDIEGYGHENGCRMAESALQSAKEKP